jgi:pectinesterase
MNSGYVINNSEVSGSSKSESFYLGRPWRQYARVTFQHTSLSNVINKAGWAKWIKDGKAEPTGNLKYYEFKNTGPGASTGGRQIGKQASAAESLGGFLGSGYEKWVDMKYMSK